MDSNKSNCIYCKCETVGMSFGSIQLPAPEVCGAEACVAKSTAEFLAKEAERNRRPDLAFPAVFADTDPSRLPPKFRQVCEGWTPKSGKGSLLIHGTTRIGKSRTAWYVCNRLHAAGVKITALTMRDIEFGLQEGFQRGDWHRVVDRWCREQFLYIDDLGKEKLTERTQSCLFQIVDDRSANKRPTLITTNYTGAGLGARFPDPETGAAFVARLREFYDLCAVAPAAPTDSD